jgi:hypothetical protein
VRAGHWFTVKVQDGVTSIHHRPDLLQRAEPVICAFDIETTKLPLRFPNSAHDQVRALDVWQHLTASCTLFLFSSCLFLDGITTFVQVLWGLCFCPARCAHWQHACPQGTFKHVSLAVFPVFMISGVHDLLHGGQAGLPHREP